MCTCQRIGTPVYRPTHPHLLRSTCLHVHTSSGPHAHMSTLLQVPKLTCPHFQKVHVPTCPHFQSSTCLIVYNSKGPHVHTSKAPHAHLFTIPKVQSSRACISHTSVGPRGQTSTSPQAHTSLVHKSIDNFTFLIASWVIRTKWREIQRFVWKCKAKYAVHDSTLQTFAFINQNKKFMFTTEIDELDLVSVLWNS